jgi:smad nuclear-interacting protein 1
MPRDTSTSPRRGPRGQEEDRSGKRGNRDSRTDFERGYGYERDSGRRRRDKGDDDRHARRADSLRRDDRRDRDQDPRNSNRELDRKNQDDRHSRRRSRDRAVPSRRSASPERPSSSRPAHARSSSRSQSRPAVDKAKPNFANSGLLAAETNAVKLTDGTSTILKYNEPPEARRPTLGWRLYVFKGSEQVGQYHMCLLSPIIELQAELLHINRQSAYLIGRDRAVADIFIEHPSCSKQHAVIQRE